MVDTASLEIRVQSSEVELASKRLGTLEKQGARTERATAGLTSAFARLVGPITAVVSISAGLSKLIDVSTEFGKLSAGLETATGSAENAAGAFQALQDFATQTPYSLQEVTDAFTRLVNYGLTPSEQALTAYGDMASAMGKSLNQMIEAVADATTGEFERLKEFGIRASAEGDRVRFTFRGVTTEVGRNAKEIEQYLISLAETNFSGGMERQMQTLGGAISNLGDEWNKLWFNISNMGVGDVIESSVRLAIDVLEELNAMLESKEIEGYLKAMASQWVAWKDDVTNQITAVTSNFDDEIKQWEKLGKEVVDFLVAAFQYWPANVRAFIQIITVEIASLVDRAAVWGRAIADNLNPFNGTTTISDIRRQIDAIGEARISTIEAILQERDSAIKSYEDQIAAARKARKEFDKTQKARRASNEDRLAGFKVGSDTGGAAATSAIDRASAAAAKKQREDFERLVESLRTEEEAIRASYEERKRIIEQNTTEESELRRDLMSRLDAMYEEQIQRLQDAKNRELEELKRALMTEEEAIRESYERRVQIIKDNTEAGSKEQKDLLSKLDAFFQQQQKDVEKQRQQERDRLYSGLLTEEEALKQSYERRKEAILESEAVTAEEKADLVKRSEEQLNAELMAISLQRMQMQLRQASDLFDSMTDLARAYAGEQSEIYRILITIEKAFAMTQTAISIAVGMSKALQKGFPLAMAEMSKVTAIGASIMAQIKGAIFSGFAGLFDEGGRIPAGKIGIVGEYGPEIVSGPANVTSRKETAKILESSAPPPAPVVNIRNINVLDPSIVGDYLSTDEGERLIMNVVQRNQRAFA